MAAAVAQAHSLPAKEGDERHAHAQRWARRQANGCSKGLLLQSAEISRRGQFQWAMVPHDGPPVLQPKLYQSVATKAVEPCAEPDEILRLR
mmetsp:Transcript_44393/g.96456  ORF Transcript_44393/g.96456 Transcript_44393/m.96456 type:complete len:91 (+) Transcript_44393:66-338(+)